MKNSLFKKMHWGLLLLSAAACSSSYQPENWQGFRDSTPLEDKMEAASLPRSIEQLLVRDLDGDGRDELVVLDLFYQLYPDNDSFLNEIKMTSSALESHHRVLIFSGQGDGSFASEASVVDLNDYPQRIYLSDLDQDGQTDLLMLYYDKFELRRGLKGLAFAEPLSYDLTNIGQELLISDFNGDGLPEIAIATSSENEDFELQIYAGNKMGNYDSAISFSSQVVKASAIDMQACDLNGDGLRDLVLSTHGAEAPVIVFWAKEGASFSEAEPLIASLDSEDPGAAFQALRCGDIDQDGDVDLVLKYGSYNEDLGKLRYYANAGSGVFKDYIRVAQGKYSSEQDLELADLNRDGRLDVVIGGYYDYSVQYILNEEGGQFSMAHTISLPTKSAVYQLVVDDINRDGFEDIVSGDRNGNLHLILNKGAAADQ